jgi:hypothetical protein
MIERFAPLQALKSGNKMLFMLSHAFLRMHREFILMVTKIDTRFGALVERHEFMASQLTKTLDYIFIDGLRVPKKIILTALDSKDVIQSCRNCGAAWSMFLLLMLYNHT